jgi:hypothetical protein
LVVVLVALIICFTAITVFALSAMLVLRRREKDFENSREIARTIDELDEALNSAISEINKMGALIKSESDEKYKSILFMYNLIEDKHKEVSEPDSEIISEMFAQYIEKHGDKITPPKENPENTNVTQDEMAELGLPIEKEQITNPKHKEIWEMRENGQDVTDIAKKLSMGKGEVKLILDLIDRTVN